MNGNNAFIMCKNEEMENAVCHNTSRINIDTNFIKTELEYSEEKYFIKKPSLTEDYDMCYSASSMVNCIVNASDDTGQTEENISETIIKPEFLELHDEFIIKEEENADDGDSLMKDIEAVYISAGNDCEELGNIETFGEEENVSEYKEDKVKATTVMDTVTDVASDDSNGKSKLHVVNTSIKKRTAKLTKKKKCYICHKTVLLSDFIRHKLIHIGGKPFKCEQCNKTFTDSSNFHHHERTHTGEETFKCDQCNKLFTDPSGAFRHKRLHKSEKPYKCEQCNKALTDSSELHRHKRMHTGEKPFKCKQCGKAFSQSVHLSDHERIHTGEKPFQCEHCNKAFSRSTHLSVHKRTHTGEKPFKCEHCNKAFSQSVQLSNHKLTHTGEKSFKCEHCNKAFSRKFSLTEHLRIHTGKKPYICEQCNKAFTHSSTLHRHKQTHTSVSQ